MFVFRINELYYLVLSAGTLFISMAYCNHGRRPQGGVLDKK